MATVYCEQVTLTTITRETERGWCVAHATIDEGPDALRGHTVTITGMIPEPFVGHCMQ